MANGWFTNEEFASLGLTGLPASRFGISEWIEREGLDQKYPNKVRPRTAAGGGIERHISILPEYIRNNYIGTQIAAAANSLPALPDRHPVAPTCDVDPNDLTDDQRHCMNARVLFVKLVHEHEEILGRTKATHLIADHAKAGSLKPELQALIPVANAKSGTKAKKSKKAHSLSQRTLYDWVLTHEREGILGLAPKRCREKDMTIPKWAPLLMQLWADPYKPSLQAVVDKLADELPPGIEPPSYFAARRFLNDKISIVDRNRGRMGPQALKSLQAFTRRDVSELWPTAVYTADGHTFRAKVEHPHHGQPFQPEITFVMDVYTRAIVGWSVGLAENSIGVLEAVSNAIVEHKETLLGGVCLIFYTDNGKGFKNDMFSADVTGFFDRWGITQKTGRAYNSQGRGIIERFNRNVRQWAKELSSYSGQDLDKEAARYITRERLKAAKKGKKSPFDVTWQAFKDFIERKITEYNHAPHDGLPRFRHPETKRWIHQAPVDVWEAWLREGNTTAFISRDDAADLMRPYERRKVARCEVHILNGSYFSHDLEAYHDQWVLVGYDIHDASRVWVRDFDMRLLAVAELDGNAAGYFSGDTFRTARSKQEQIFENRTKGRLGRVEEKRREILLEAKGAPLEIEHQSGHVMPPLDDFSRAEADAALAKLSEPQPTTQKILTINGRPNFADDVQWVRWLLTNPNEVTDQDRTAIRKRLGQPSFRHLLEMEGIDPMQLRQAA